MRDQVLELEKLFLIPFIHFIAPGPPLSASVAKSAKMGAITGPTSELL